MAFFVGAFILLIPQAAFAEITTFKNNTGQPVNDVHIYVYLDEDHSNPVNVTNGQILVPNTWTSSVAGNSIDGDGTSSGPMVPQGGSIKVRVETALDGGEDPPDNYFYIVQWTYYGIDKGDPQNSTQSSVSLTTDATVQRAIKLNVSNSILSFSNRLRFGRSYEATTTVSVVSNENWELYVSGEPDLGASGGRDILEFLSVGIRDTAGHESGIFPPGGVVQTDRGALVGGEPVPLIPFPDGTVGPPVDSFFDVFVELEPLPKTRAGYYKGYIIVTAVQHF
ncbi:MAG: hypothetical protein ACYC1U_08560 [Candidatus Aquicultorales bacterium]